MTLRPGAPPPDEFVNSLLKTGAGSTAEEGASAEVRGVQVGVTVSYSFKKSSSFDPIDALMALQRLRGATFDHGITDWSLAQPSLEEVFVNIATRYTTTSSRSSSL